MGEVHAISVPSCLNHSGKKERHMRFFPLYSVAYHNTRPENEAEEYEEDFLHNMKNVIRAVNRELITSDCCDYIIDSWRPLSS